MTLAAIIIGAVVAYISAGAVVGGFVRERTGEEDTAILAGVLWPLAVVMWLGVYAAVRLGGPLIRLGRRLAAPKPQLPAARAVRADEETAP